MVIVVDNSERKRQAHPKNFKYVSPTRISIIHV